MGLVVRTIRLARATVKIDLANLAPNICRMIWLVVGEAARARAKPTRSRHRFLSKAMVSSRWPPNIPPPSLIALETAFLEVSDYPTERAPKGFLLRVCITPFTILRKLISNVGRVGFPLIIIVSIVHEIFSDERIF